MKQPTDIHDALRRINALTASVAADLENYLMDENPTLNFSAEYFEPIKDAALDANLLATWVRDRLSYPKEDS